MPIDFPTSRPAPEGDVSLVGVLSWSELQNAGSLDRLSEPERNYFASVTHSRRRQSWLAGRMAAKYCFLRTFGASATGLQQSRMPARVFVDARSLDAFSPWMYRQVEVLPAPAGGPPRFSWSGRPCGVRLSLSHTAGQSCAYLDSRGPIGLDIEEALPRREAFYRRNFTRSEQEWAERIARETGATRAWVYTLLWTIKESALKSDESGRGTIWDMPLVEVAMPAESGGPVFAPSRGPLGAVMSTFTVRVSQAGQESLFRVGVSATEKRILSVMKRISN
jgi:phosphopantetheinyl transferase